MKQIPVSPRRLALKPNSLNTPARVEKANKVDNIYEVSPTEGVTLHIKELSIIISLLKTSKLRPVLING